MSPLTAVNVACVEQELRIQALRVESPACKAYRPLPPRQAGRCRCGKRLPSGGTWCATCREAYARLCRSAWR